MKFASGSLRQYLDITHDEKIDSKDTPAEDIEGKLYQFVPSDYTKSDSSFGEWVEKDAEVFKPLGEKMSSYVRPSAAALAQAGGGAKKGKAKGKGKGKANGSAVALTIEEGSDDAVVYEVYKVSFRLGFSQSCLCSLTIGNVEHSWLSRLPPPHAAVYPPLYRRRKLRARG